MKWIYLALACLIITSSVFAQEEKEKEKISYISLSGNGGLSGFNYSIPGDKEKKWGYGGQIGYSYFFNRHWGVSSGVGISYYKTLSAMYDTRSFGYGMQQDDDNISGNPREFELRARLKDWEEKQTTYFLKIPVMGNYQTYFGEEENWGIYANAGFKVLIPVSSKYKMSSGSLNVSGYYPHSDIDKGAPGNPPVPQHGFGTTDDLSPLDRKGKLKLKTSIVASVEAGFLIKLNERFDLMTGGYLDYGLNKLEKGKVQARDGIDPLLTAPTNYLPGANNNIGAGFRYNGMSQAGIINKIKSFSVGFEITLRYRLGSEK